MRPNDAAGGLVSFCDADEVVVDEILSCTLQLAVTRYIDAAVASLRAAGHEVLDEDVARLSPLGHAHINMLGRYSFAASIGAGLRALRDPAAGPDEGA